MEVDDLACWMTREERRALECLPVSLILFIKGRKYCIRPHVRNTWKICNVLYCTVWYYIAVSIKTVKTF